MLIKNWACSALGICRSSLTELVEFESLPKFYSLSAFASSQAVTKNCPHKFVRMLYIKLCAKFENSTLFLRYFSSWLDTFPQVAQAMGFVAQAMGVCFTGYGV